MHVLPVYDDNFIKTKASKFGNKIYANFRDLVLPEYGVKYEYFTIISICLRRQKYYLQV